MSIELPQSQWAFPPEWVKMPAEKLKIALEAIEPQMVRDHERAMYALKIRERQIEVEQAQFSLRLERSHRLSMIGKSLGFAIAMATMTAAVITDLHGDRWLPALLAGPSLLALAKLFVLRKSDASDMKAVNRAAGVRGKASA